MFSLPFPFIPSQKISIEKFLHTLVYNLIYTLFPALVYTVKSISILFYTCPLYICLNFLLLLLYCCLYMSIHTFLYIAAKQLLVHIIVNTYFTKLSSK